VLFHQEEVSDALVGLMAGYVVWSNLVPETHKATAVTEQIVGPSSRPGRPRPGDHRGGLIRDTPLPPRPQAERRPESSTETDDQGRGRPSPDETR
jgi:hypothetical protein